MSIKNLLHCFGSPIQISVLIFVFNKLLIIFLFVFLLLFELKEEKFK